MKSDKKMAILITAIVAASAFAAIPATGIPTTPPPYPEPDLGWPPFSTGADITDVAVGDLTLNGTADVAFIDYTSPQTVFAVYGNNGTEYWNETTVYGYSIAVGDVDGDGKNEVMAGGRNTSEGKPGITVFENDGTVKFFYETNSQWIKDIELGDLDDDGVDDIVACNAILPDGEGWIYAFNGTDKSNLTGWPRNFEAESFFDIALGNLGGGLGIAALSADQATLYAFNSTGGELWPPNTTVSGRSVEIGDVDGDTKDEVVIGNCNWTTGYGVYVYDGATGNLKCFFGTESRIEEIELGDLDGDPSDLEIAALASEPTTLYALNVEVGTLVELWNFSISWFTRYYGEGLAIGDVDRDYKNEVIAGAEESMVYVDGFDQYSPINGERATVGAVTSTCFSVYAFDGLDSNDDGEGDVVWQYVINCSGVERSYSYDRVASEISVGAYNQPYAINDIEVGDVDGDGDMDVIVGTNGGYSLYALFTQEHTIEVGGETIFFDSDPSNITEVASVPMPPNPPEGYNFPYGVFAINITVPVPGQWANITITLPDDLPANAEYWKYTPNGNGSPSGQPGWYQIPLESNDGDNVIVIRLQDGGRGDADGEANGWIIDQGGPATPPERLPVLTPLGIAALVGLLSIVATSTLLKRRKRA